MKRLRSMRLSVFSFAMTLVGVVGFAQAQTAFPTKPITVVIPYPAGGSPDIGMRFLQQKFSEAIGAPVVLLNKPGASGMVGMAFVANAEPDGYTLAATTSSSITVVQIGSAKVPYNTTDFVPLGNYAVDVSTLIVAKDSPFANFDALVAAAKSRPGALNFGTPGAGTLSSLNLSSVKDGLGLDIMEVPFPGTPQVMTNILGKQIDGGAAAFSSFAGAVEDGRLRSLVVAGHKRLAKFPDIPTLAEKGLKDGGLNLNLGLFAPKGTPEAVVQKLQQAIKKAAADPTVVASIEKAGMVAEFEEPDDVVKSLEREHAGVVVLGQKLKRVK
ncbi:MAG: tripartite tricarboxylate transporter substrate binding protein [Rhizobiales bacterium]|nr:tripartite tricarboxylate transporter substrate binding protein [Hyphomicrobiales bacterium]